MSYNVPSYDSTRFTFGPGILYMGAPGATPSIDIGAVKGDASLDIERTLLEVKQGTPHSTVAQYAVEESIVLKVTGIEWNLNNLAYCMGAGITSVSGANEVLEFGGDMGMNNRALRYVHIAPDGSTIDMHIFKAQGNGKLNISMKEKDFHEFAFEFEALEGSVDFTNAALASNKKKFKIIRTKV